MTKEQVAVQTDRPLTKEERIEESWKFLPIITDKVASLSENIQKQIKQYGIVLRDQGAIYIHVVEIARIAPKARLNNELPSTERSTSQGK